MREILDPEPSAHERHIDMSNTVMSSNRISMDHAVQFADLADVHRRSLEPADRWSRVRVALPYSRARRARHDAAFVGLIEYSALGVRCVAARLLRIQCGLGGPKGAVTRAITRPPPSTATSRRPAARKSPPARRQS